MVEKSYFYMFSFRDQIVCRYNLVCSSALTGHFCLSIFDMYASSWAGLYEIYIVHSKYLLIHHVNCRTNVLTVKV